MNLPRQAALMRIYTDEAARAGHKSLFEAIVCKARDQGIAGATVLRGPMGFGASSVVHTTKLLELSRDLPVVVEIVDAPDKIQALLPFLDEAVTEGLVTIEEVRVLKYRHNPDKAQG